MQFHCMPLPFITVPLPSMPLRTFRCLCCSTRILALLCCAIALLFFTSLSLSRVTHCFAFAKLQPSCSLLFLCRSVLRCFIPCRAFALRIRSLLLFAIATRLKSSRSLRVPNQLVALAAHILAVAWQLQASLCLRLVPLLFTFLIISKPLHCKSARLFALAHQFSVYLCLRITHPCHSTPLRFPFACCLSLFYRLLLSPAFSSVSSSPAHLHTG